MGFSSSVVDYPDRGPYGNNKYRGNCSGYFIREFIGTYCKGPQDLFVDVAIGGGTSVDVANELGMNFHGFDLRDGFNVCKDDLSQRTKPADLVFFHPPYANMIAYSGNMWGNEPHEWDMGRMDVPVFTKHMEFALYNMHNATKVGGHYGVLIGNLRRKGKYYNLGNIVERICPGVLVDEIIKTQHNNNSDSRVYTGSFVPIMHEKLLVFRKTPDVNLMNQFNKTVEACSKNSENSLLSVLRLGLMTSGPSHLQDIVRFISGVEHNKEWVEGKIRELITTHPNLFSMDNNVVTLV